MSGRLVITLTLSLCLLMVGVALWKRSSGTAQVREFWGAEQARLIQHASHVRAMSLQTTADNAWSDASKAPGLIHLRATLVDDRYYQWPASDMPQLENDSTWVFQFSEGDQTVELNINTATGTVVNPKSHRSVRLIEASRRAIDVYLKEIFKR